MPKKSSRRDFLKSSMVAAGCASLPAFGAIVPSAVLGANDRINMGFIGVGNRGSQLLRGFMQQSDVRIAALCDVYEPYLQRDPSKVHPHFVTELGNNVPKMGEKFLNVKRFHDFRKLLESKDIDAVCIATPDHWHAIQTIMAMEVDKDVYIEKPLTITLHEGRKMVEAAKRTARIVQVGLNRRGSSAYQKAVQWVRAGEIGKVTFARAYRVSNMYPDGIKVMKPENPPEGLDWDMWLGPRAYRPYQYNIAPYKFRWWSDYSTQMGNWGVHYLDAIRWLAGEKAPSAISAQGGKYFVTDDRTIPDTMEVTFEFASGLMVVFGIYEATGGNMLQKGEVELHGTKAMLAINDRGYSIEPSRPGQFQTWSSSKAAIEWKPETPEDITVNLIRNFCDCVKTRQTPDCPLEEGHRSTSFAHLANIALEMKTRLLWDAEQERFTNHDQANDLLHYEYRKPWALQ